MVARAEACCRGLAIGTLANGAQVLGVARRNDCLLAIAALHVEAHEIDPLLPWRNGGTN